MKYEFVKLHGLGNDFIVIDDFSQEIELSNEDIVSLCDRHFGIGADGIILMRPSHNSDCIAYMHYINSDGTLAEMCGNGVRCFAKYLVDRHFVPDNESSFIADTLAGIRPISFTRDERGDMDFATVNMQQPILDATSVPTLLEENAKTADGKSFVRETSLDSPWGQYNFTCVSMGNPHAICFIDDWEVLPDTLFSGSPKSIDTFLIDEIGAYFESHEMFPQKTNVEFACIEEDGIHMRVFERGCGETFACGTGACATLVGANITERSGRHNDVVLLGGTLHIDWDQSGNVMMTGPAKESFTGSVEI